MNSELIEDLKQFITATVSQATGDLATKGDISRLEGKVEDLDLKVDTIAETHTEDHTEIGKRLTRLEQNPAL